MSSASVAVLLWLVLIFLPGFAVLRLVRFPGSPALLLTSSAPVSVGLLYLVALAATRTSMSIRGACLAVLLILLVAWLGAEFWRARTRPGADQPARLRLRNAVRGELAHWRIPALAAGRALALASAVFGVVLWHQLHIHLTVPSGWDSMHHAFFVRQIATHDTLKSSVVFSSDPGGAADGAGFYPLAMNVMAALIHVWTGISISSVLLGSSVAIVGVSLPLATYGLVRRLLPDQPVTAGFAALASVLPALLYTIEYTGRLTDVQGLALVPATLSLLVAVGVRFDWRVLVAAPLAIVGVIGLHTSELPIVVGLLLAYLIVEGIRHRNWPAIGRFALGFAAAAAVTAIVLLALAPGIGKLASQRTGAFGPAHGGNLPFVTSLRYVSSLPQWGPQANHQPMHIWVIAALIGCVLILALPRWRPLSAIALGYIGYSVFYTAWVFGHVGPFAPLANGWYRIYTRMQWEFCVLGAIPVGVTLAVAATLVWRGVLALRRPNTDPPARAHRAVAAVLATGAALAIALPMVAPIGIDSRWLRVNASPVGSHEQAAFAYLQKHVQPGQRVLDDLDIHGDTWMFVDYGVPNVFGNPPLIGLAPASWKERLYLRARMPDIATDGCVNHLLTKFNVAWVYFSKSRMFGGRIHVPLHDLETMPQFHLAFSSGGAYVFSIDRSGLPTKCTRDLTTEYPWSTLGNAK